MEIGSSGGGAGGSGGGGDDQRHGLKFGKKIYFEDAAAPASGGGSGGASASASPPPPPSSPSSSRARKGKAPADGSSSSASAPAQCQVEGCDADLRGVKLYYRRHKVCPMHGKYARVVVAGLEQRFCQQCSRFHQLPEFDQRKRSCRRRLLGHNERRRRPPPGRLASRFGQLTASFGEEPGRRFLLDFSYPRVPSSVRDIRPAVRPGSRMPGGIQWQGSLDPHAHPSVIMGYGTHAYSSQGSSSAGPPSFPGPGLPLGGRLTGVATDSSCALSLLSTQPWDATHGASHNRTTVMSSPGFGGNLVAPSVMASNYMAPNPWSSSRSHEGARNVPHQLPHEVPLGAVHPSSSHQRQFSGELELALQGNGPAPPQRMDHDSNSEFHQAGSSSNWSL